MIVLIKTKLPDEFKPWTRLAEELVDLLARKKLRAKVDKVCNFDFSSTSLGCRGFSSLEHS